MKKFFVPALLLIFGLMTLTGCGSTGSSGGTGTSTIPVESLAESVVYASRSLALLNDTLFGVIGSSGVKSSQVGTATPSELVYSDGWWTATYNYSAEALALSFVYNFKVWDSSNVELTNISDLQVAIDEGDVSKLSMYCTLNYEAEDLNFATYYGASKSAPLVYTISGAGAITINGQLKYASTYDSTSYSVTMSLSGLTMGNDGFPSGTVSFSVAEGETATVSGTITYNGTNTASISITSAGTTYTYTCNLETGTVTPASL